MVQTVQPKRTYRTERIMLPTGYKIEVVEKDLTTPIGLTITDQNELLIADAGITSGKGKVYRMTATGPTLLADGFNPPLTGITFYKGNVYVSHRGVITRVSLDGKKQDLITGLPSYGDHHNNRVVFGADGKMYFGQGTATNSGIVGEDNHWLKRYPFFHDYPGAYVQVAGENFKTEDLLTDGAKDIARTGPYSPFGVPVYPNEIIKPMVKASGSILRANVDGSGLELFAWGLRNPFGLKFDRYQNLFCTNHGMDVRGSRPVVESPDEFQWVRQGMWYGWPDYTGGLPVTNPKFKPEGQSQLRFLLARHPMVPPKPIAVFASHSASMGFDFNYHPSFGATNEAFIAEFGSEAPETTGGKLTPVVGHRVSRINPSTGKITVFAMNERGVPASESDGGGVERPIDIVFSKEGELYIVDFGYRKPPGTGEGYIPQTGVVWKVTRQPF
ncbi:PQQ-dependent sugar dehydrogenase [Bacillus sp. BRMEA1]|uniref:PQQ-dependent sugar dehydrogenase n=1 Tax=Neobacillus endophyticus TaxID=2738405 RepID=UPI0015666D3A|nr:PQQ-dependent sugar dehydrogenase [Neobacillus endophyticus]NRD76287.1 PQQ-dependent sugar dehydrogenase [Neobacillus endophyticus]